jgi:hypothetical protein
MESQDEEVSETSFEFSVEEMEEALKKKPGRPSTRTRELRQRLEEADKLRDILGILNSGILERIDEFTDGGFDRSSSRSSIREEPKPKDTKNSEGFAIEILKKTGLINDKIIKNNPETFSLLDDMVRDSLVNYGPPIIGILGALGGLWVAESKIKGVPPILHTSMLILKLFAQVLNSLTPMIEGAGKAFQDIAGVIPKVQTNIEDIVEDPLGKGQDFIDSEIKKIQSLIAKALKGDILALLELSVRVNPATFAAIMAGEFVLGGF